MLKRERGYFILPLMPCHLRRSVRSWNTCLSQPPLRLRWLVLLRWRDTLFSIRATQRLSWMILVWPWFFIRCCRIWAMMSSRFMAVCARIVTLLINWWTFTKSCSRLIWRFWICSIWIRLKNKRICSGFSVRLRISCWQEILTINQNLVPSSRKLSQAIWIRPWVTRFWSLMALRVSLLRRRP